MSSIDSFSFKGKRYINLKLFKEYRIIWICNLYGAYACLHHDFVLTPSGFGTVLQILLHSSSFVSQNYINISQQITALTYTREFINLIFPTLTLVKIICKHPDSGRHQTSWNQGLFATRGRVVEITGFFLRQGKQGTSTGESKWGTQVRIQARHECVTF